MAIANRGMDEAAHGEGREVSRGERPKARTLYLFVVLLGAAMFTLSLSGYPNLMDNEYRVGNYVLDAIHNGHWIIQRDVAGGVASKPPLLTWMAALITLGSGHINSFAVHLPSALAAVGVALVILAAGDRYFGWQAGLLGAVMYLLSDAGDQQMMTARYDGLLALGVAAAAVAAFRAWSLGRGWTWFWLAAAFGTLAKGPVALLLGACGLLSYFWERRSGYDGRLSGSQWPGLAVFLALCGGWFLLAYADVGKPLLEKMLVRELADHATGAGRRETMLLGFYKPALSFLSGFAPWSLLACVGFWRVARHPAPMSEERRFERFLFCWFFPGLLLFSVVAHHRGRLIYPLIAPAALLAGREGARWLQSCPPRQLIKLVGALALATLCFLGLYHHGLLARSTRVQKTVGMRDLAASVRGRFGEGFPLVHVDTLFLLQFYLNTAWPLASAERAAELLKGDFPALVAVSDFDLLQSRLQPNGPALFEFARWPKQGPPFVRIVSNRPLTEPLARLATLLGPWLVQMENLRFVCMSGPEIVVQSGKKPGALWVTNQSGVPRTLRVRLLAEGAGTRDSVAERVLAPGETWRPSL